MHFGIDGFPFDRENTASGRQREMPIHSNGARIAAEVLGNRERPVAPLQTVPGTQPLRTEPQVTAGGPTGARVTIPDGGDASNVRGWRGQRNGE